MFGPEIELRKSRTTREMSRELSNERFRDKVNPSGKKSCFHIPIDAHRGGTSCTPYKDFEKLPHKNAIKTTPPLIFSQSQVPPSQEFAKNPKDPPPPPGFPTTVHLCTLRIIKDQEFLRQFQKEENIFTI